MPEISDQELALANKYKGILDKFWNDPEEGLNFKRRLKKLVPDAQIPELDMIDTTVRPLEEKLAKKDEAISKLSERLDNIEKSKKDEKEEGELIKSLDSARRKFNLTDEGFDKAIARMKEMNNPDAEAAAAWVAAQERKAKPVTGSAFGPSAINLYGTNSEDANWEALNKNPEKWFDNEVATILNEYAEAEAA